MIKSLIYVCMESSFYQFDITKLDSVFPLFLWETQQRPLLVRKSFLGRNTSAISWGGAGGAGETGEPASVQRHLRKLPQPNCKEKRCTDSMPFRLAFCKWVQGDEPHGVSPPFGTLKSQPHFLGFRVGAMLLQMNCPSLQASPAKHSKAHPEERWVPQNMTKRGIEDCKKCRKRGKNKQDTSFW